MSSLDSHRQMFVVQSGVVAWEETEPLVDWTWKTVSLVAGKLSSAVPLLWSIVASRPARFGRVFRFYLAPVPAGMTETQKRRLVARLRTDPPGFSETTLEIVDSHACIMSALRSPAEVDSDFLTEYRRCALVEFDEGSSTKSAAFADMCATIGDLGGSSIGKLLGGARSVAILRVLDLKSHAVIQIIGSSEVTDAAIRCLTEQGIQQLHDVRTLPQAIASFRE